MLELLNEHQYKQKDRIARHGLKAKNALEAKKRAIDKKLDAGLLGNETKEPLFDIVSLVNDSMEADKQQLLF